MIHEFHITTASNNTDGLLADLNQRAKWIHQQGYNISVDIDQMQIPDIDKLIVKLQGSQFGQVFRDEDILCVFKHQVAEVIAEHILTQWEDKLIWKEIGRTGRTLSEEEKQFVYDKTVEFLHACQDNEKLNRLLYFGRKSRITNRVLEYINENNYLLVEGFITFCLRDYLAEIKFAVEIAYEELRSEKEYNDFITLLRFYVETQTPKITEVNVLMTSNSFFYLWDGNGMKIDDRYMDYYVNELRFNEINFDDVLISILITIAPRRIILHNGGDLSRQSVKTILKVFSDRIRICSGCPQCHHILNNGFQQ
ncbi:MAG: sporulation protein YtxC [Syntrophomonadaceae bacterium]|jgi:putative sporulation protein YtxC